MVYSACAKSSLGACPPCRGNFKPKPVMAEKRWLASRKKRSRDIRDFVTVHGKIINPCQEQSETHLSTTSQDARKKMRQIPLHASRHKEEVKIPASCFSKGVRKKASYIATGGGRSSNVVECRGTTSGGSIATRGHTGLTKKEEKENFHLGQGSTITKNNLLKRPAAKRDPLRLLRSQSPERELPCNPSTSTPFRTPPVTMEMTSSPLLFSPNTSICTAQPSHYSTTEESKQESCLYDRSTTPQPSDDIRAPSMGGLREPPSLSNMSFSFSDSLQIDSLSRVSWDTERLLAELSSCEKL